MKKWIIAMLAGCMLLPSVVAAAQPYGAIAVGLHARFNMKHKIAFEEGFFALGAALAETKKNAVKLCKKDIHDYNAQQRCKANVVAAPIKGNYFASGVCAFGFSRSGVGIGHSYASAMHAVHAYVVKGFLSIGYFRANWTRAQISNNLECQPMRVWHNGKRIK